MKSLYDLSFDFLNKYYETEPPVVTKAQAIKDFEIVLNDGWTSEEIEDKLSRIPANGSVPDPYIVFTGYRKQENILKGGQFYFHNLLRCCPPPPTQAWDVNTGIITTISEPFYLEMRASITLDQIVDYYSKQMHITVDSGNISRYKGSFKYMIDKHGIDLVLFMIDTTRDMVQGEDLPKPSSPVGIAEYITEAEARLNSKIDENRATGDDKIVAKRRIFTNRSRSEATELGLHQEYDYYA